MTTYQTCPRCGSEEPETCDCSPCSGCGEHTPAHEQDASGRCWLCQNERRLRKGELEDAALLFGQWATGMAWAAAGRLEVLWGFLQDVTSPYLRQGGDLSIPALPSATLGPERMLPAHQE